VYLAHQKRKVQKTLSALGTLHQKQGKNTLVFNQKLSQDFQRNHQFQTLLQIGLEGRQSKPRLTD